MPLTDKGTVMLAVLLMICAAFAVALVLRDRRVRRQRSEFVAAQRATIDEMKKRRTP